MSSQAPSDCLRYQLFGMGLRRKLLYQAGRLRDALSGEVLHTWNVRNEEFRPATYRVDLETSEGPVSIREDEEAVWLHRRGGDEALTRAPVKLPDFEPHPHAALLRVLHAELLINTMPWGPVPNLWVYPRPWYRDAAMMALAFEHTSNVAVIEDWIEGLTVPFDFNNRGEEPDNLGQTLYLAGLTSGQRHPVVAKTLKEAEKFRRGDHLFGLTDYGEHPVYQTKWLKFGLRRLGLDDPWRIPLVPDSYSALFWMDYRDQHVPGPRFGAGPLPRYPYLNWAEAHFHDEPPPEPLPSADAFPLTREVASSAGNYSRMRLVSDAWAAARWSSPHTWHGVEIFLYLLDHPRPRA